MGLAGVFRDLFHLQCSQRPDLARGLALRHGGGVRRSSERFRFSAPGRDGDQFGYWNSSFDYVDYTDGVAGYLSRVLQDTIDYRDIWYVRDAISAVPEPAAWALMIGGFGVVGAGMRQRRKPSPSVRFA